ncbi:hypothetical protein C7B80_26565 [Cyanosarcina cf. burmensis CCALA 770]|nr:hypothetical protein C7B80_26565 [Cyanosarcina cf. burmensis CCALA 770]
MDSFKEMRANLFKPSRFNVNIRSILFVDLNLIGRSLLSIQCILFPILKSEYLTKFGLHQGAKNL